MKKLSIFVLALVTCAGTMFASDTSVDGIWYKFNNGNLTAEVTYQGAAYNSYSNEYSGEVVIPASVTYNAQTYTVTSIGNQAFRKCTGLTSVTIPNSVTIIGEEAFYQCSGLTSVTIPNSVTIIGEDAFRACSGLTSVTIPNSVTIIGEGAFVGCSGLTSVTIPNSVTIIGERAFYGCSSLTSLYVEAGNTVYDSRNNCNAIIKTSTNTLIFGCQNTTIPNSVTIIGYEAFRSCSGLTSVTIPNSVTSIGDWAFADCSGLTSVTIPNSVTSIGDSAFRWCSGLTSVTNYATTPQTIYSNVFEYVNKSTCVLNVPKESVSLYQAAEVWKEFKYIVGVDVPKDNSVDGIWYNFDDGNLTAEVTYQGDEYDSYWDEYSGEVVIPSSVTYNDKTYSVTSIGNDAFDGCSGLTSVTIPNSVTSIGDYAFYNCDGLTSIEIPNSVTSIGDEAFYGCTGLTSVTIGNSVTSIGYGAFRECTGLTSITNYATTPQSINSKVFLNVDKSTCVLNVPKESVSLYQAADVWEVFTNIVGVDVPEEPIETIEGDYTISYVDKDSQALYNHVVTLYVPVAPTITGFTFLRWETVAADIKLGITIQAVYQADVPASAPAVYTNPANPAQKLIKNGNVYILTDDKTYTITGQKIK